jgi:hypothetical protein
MTINSSNEAQKEETKATQIMANMEQAIKKRIDLTKLSLEDQ